MSLTRLLQRHLKREGIRATSRAIDISPGQLSRFANHGTGLSLKAADKLLTHLQDKGHAVHLSPNKFKLTSGSQVILSTDGEKSPARDRAPNKSEQRRPLRKAVRIRQKPKEQTGLIVFGDSAEKELSDRQVRKAQRGGK